MKAGTAIVVVGCTACVTAAMIFAPPQVVIGASGLAFLAFIAWVVGQ
jgi:hypothetical protein